MEEKNTDKRILVLDKHPICFAPYQKEIEALFSCDVNVTDGVLEAICWLEGDRYNISIIEPYGQIPASLRGLLDDFKERKIPVLLFSGEREADLQRWFALVKGEDYVEYYPRVCEDRRALYLAIDGLL